MISLFFMFSYDINFLRILRQSYQKVIKEPESLQKAIPTFDLIIGSTPPVSFGKVFLPRSDLLTLPVFFPVRRWQVTSGIRNLPLVWGWLDAFAEGYLYPVYLASSLPLPGMHYRYQSYSQSKAHPLHLVYPFASLTWLLSPYPLPLTPYPLPLTPKGYGWS